jgi:RNA polymerase sigma-70 factor (ECF subfamily)
MEGESIEPAVSDPWAAVALELSGQEVRKALDELPAEQRQTIELAYYAGYSQSEIATKMEVPLGTVKGRVRIALDKLRTSLADRLETPWPTQ